MKRLRDENFGDSALGRLRKRCWNLTEYPETSLAARVMLIIPNKYISTALAILQANFAVKKLATIEPFHALLFTFK